MNEVLFYLHVNTSNNKKLYLESGQYIDLNVPDLFLDIFGSGGGGGSASYASPSWPGGAGGYGCGGGGGGSLWLAGTPGRGGNGGSGLVIIYSY
jgi:hypothetical protein